MSSNNFAAVRLFVTSAGNEFMTDVAKTFLHGFREAGVAAELRIDEVPRASPNERVLELIVAPHEYFLLFLDKQILSAREQTALSRSLVVNVEQPGTSWFDLTYEYAKRGSGVIDISDHGAKELRNRGLRVFKAPIGYTPAMECSDGARKKRDIDILFLGYLSPRREAFFSRHAETLKQWQCALHFIRGDRPIKEGTEGYLSGADRSALLKRAKIVLNLHARENTYFETHRALLAIANRCLFMSETSEHTGPLVPGRHFIMAAENELVAQCHTYLNSDAARRRIAQAGYRMVKTRHKMSDICANLLDELASAMKATTRPAKKAILTTRNEKSKTYTNARYKKCSTPAVSVVITVYNYAHYVEHCLDSLRGVVDDRLPGPFEVIVVDDGSSDDSVGTVRKWMRSAPYPLKLVCRPKNGGPSAARNAGINASRARYVFILDADNWVYPKCLERHYACIDGSNYAAVYGMLVQLDDKTGEPLGLVSTYDWSEEYLVRGPYIDSMALYDREALLAVGGFPEDLVHGWEDYQLWLSLAEAGYTAKLVPEIVGAYRVHPGSVSDRAAINQQNLKQHFRKRFAHLARKHPGMSHYFFFPADAPAPAETIPSPIQIDTTPRLRAVVAASVERHFGERGAQWIRRAAVITRYLPR